MRVVRMCVALSTNVSELRKKVRKRPIQALLLFAAACAAGPAMAALPVAYPTQTLSPLPSEHHQYDDTFGKDIAVDGSTAVVGIPGYGSDPGSAAVFTRGSDGSWTRVVTLKSSSAKTFGRAVAISSGRMLIASQASIYLYALKDGVWQYVEKIGLGFSANVRHVRLSENFAAVNVVDTSAYRSYVLVYGFSDQNFLKSIAKLTPNGGYVYEFGGDMALSDNTLVLGGEESAYVFTCSTSSCRQQQKLIPKLGDDDTGLSFGRAVAVRGSTLLVSSPYWQGSETAEGRVWVYTLKDNVWTVTGYLRPTSQQAPGGYRLFGEMLALGPDRLVVAAQAVTNQPTNDINQFTYAYGGSTFTPVQVLAGSGDPKAIAISGRTALSSDFDGQPEAPPIVDVYTLK